MCSRDSNNATNWATSTFLFLSERKYVEWNMDMIVAMKI